MCSYEIDNGVPTWEARMADFESERNISISDFQFIYWECKFDKVEKGVDMSIDCKKN